MAASTPAIVLAAALALVCLSMHSIGFAVPAVELTQAKGFGAPVASAMPAANAAPLAQTSGAQPNALLALSAVVGMAMGAKSKMGRLGLSSKTPDETYKIVIGGGEARLDMTTREIILQGIVTGFYIGFGGVLCTTVGASVTVLHPAVQRLLFGAIGFPLSIFLTTIAGGQGFTPNISVMATAFLRKGSDDEERTSRWSKMIYNLVVAYAGNAIGLVTIAFLANAAALPAVPAAIGIGMHKCEMTFTQVVFRGILGGWLIGLAVWTAQAAQSVASKFVTIWLCISTYVVCQYEHCLANIFFVPCAIFAGAPITWGHFITSSLIPSTIGNMIGGLAMLAGFYRSVYGPKAHADEQKEKALQQA